MKTAMDLTGVVLGTPWSLLEVIGPGPDARNGKPQWWLSCMTCGQKSARLNELVWDHRSDGQTYATNYCGSCRYEHENPGQTASRTKNPNL